MSDKIILPDEELQKVKEQLETFTFDDCVGSVQVGPLTFRVEHDPDPTHPLEYYDCFDLVVFERDHQGLTNVEFGEYKAPLDLLDHDQFNDESLSEDELEMLALRKFVAYYELAVALPVTIKDYGSSGVRISAVDNPDFVHTSKQGYFIATPKQVKQWSGKNYVWPKDIASISEGMRSALEDLENWAQGCVYSFVIEDAEEEVLESCGGYLGWDHEESGLITFGVERLADLFGLTLDRFERDENQSKPLISDAAIACQQLRQLSHVRAFL